VRARLVSGLAVVKPYLQQNFPAGKSAETPNKTAALVLACLGMPSTSDIARQRVLRLVSMNINQKAVAYAMGMSQSQMSKWLNGKGDRLDVSAVDGLLRFEAPEQSPDRLHLPPPSHRHPPQDGSAPIDLTPAGVPSGGNAASCSATFGTDERHSCYLIRFAATMAAMTPASWPTCSAMNFGVITSRHDSKDAMSMKNVDSHVSTPPSRTDHSPE
jgi:hypothetical protein